MAPIDRALAAREAYLSTRSAQARRRYEAALRACSTETALELLARVGVQALCPAERGMPRLGAALRQVVHL